VYLIGQLQQRDELLEAFGLETLLCRRVASLPWRSKERFAVADELARHGFVGLLIGK
jgi:hypothetical protein